MGLAMQHRDVFGSVATLAGPVNMRYSNSNGVYVDDFDPMTYRWKTGYDPKEVIGILLCRPPASCGPEVP